MASRNKLMSGLEVARPVWTLDSWLWEASLVTSLDSWRRDTGLAYSVCGLLALGSNSNLDGLSVLKTSRTGVQSALRALGSGGCLDLVFKS